MAFVTENIFLIAIALISGAMLLWPTLAGRAGAASSLDVLGATRLINDRDPVVVDVRPAADYETGHLINAKNIPLDDLETRAGEIPANRPVLLTCATGMSSGKAASKLRSAGREEAFSLAGGLNGWTGAGLPVVKK
ncbi:MAG: rhodanese-like domain-containing protein [Burkholderiaceae bacterium]